jgi:hypothetical protein
LPPERVAVRGARIGSREVASVMPDDVSTLLVPARGPWLDVVRLFVTSIAETCGLGADVIDDLRLIITEICADAPGTSEGVVAIEVSGRDKRLVFRCDGVMPLSRLEEASNPVVLRGRLLEALLPHATWLRTGDQPATVLFDVAMG